MFQLRHGDRHGLVIDVAGISDRDRLGLGIQSRRAGGLGQVHLDALHRDGGEQDEDDQEHKGQVQHRGDVDVVVGLSGGLQLHRSYSAARRMWWRRCSSAKRVISRSPKIWVLATTSLFWEEM